MPTYTDTPVSQMIHNVLTSAQYAALEQNNQINANELYYITDDDSVATAITRAIAELDSSIAATSNQAISAITITDGKIASSSKISVPSGRAASKDVDTSISTGSTSVNLPTTAAVVNYVEDHVSSTEVKQIVLVQSLPASPDANTLYLIPE